MSEDANTKPADAEQPLEAGGTAQDAPAQHSPYPPGFEPELEGEALEAARRKERRYTWMVRVELLLLLLVAALVVYFIVTS